MDVGISKLVVGFMMPSTFVLNPTLSFTLLGTFVIFLWSRPARSAWLAVFILAVGLRAACAKLMGSFGGYYGVSWISWGAFLGIASLMVLAAQTVLSRDRLRNSERRSHRKTFYAGAVFPLCSLLIGYTVPLMIWLRHRTYDAFLLAFDGSLGFQPSFVLGRFLPAGSKLWSLTAIAYYVLPLVVCILYASHLASERAGQRQSVPILALFLSLIFVGFLQYGIYPAVGPRPAFGDLYPWNPPSLARIAIQPMTVPDAPRNCMPSLHMAGALAIWWNSRLWPQWGRVLTFFFLCVTIFSTLALGEHYLVDLVVAVPFTLIFQAAWTVSVPFADSVRRKAVLVGTMVTAGWFGMLRYGLRLFFISPAVSWGLIFITVAYCLVLENRLSAAAQTISTPPRPGS